MKRTRKHWLDGAPKYVYDIMDFSAPDLSLYDVLLYSADSGMTGAQGMALSGDGAYSAFYLDAGLVAQYRRRHGRRRIKWIDLPLAVRRAVIQACAMESES